MSSIPNAVRLRILWRRLKYADRSVLILNALVFIAWVLLGAVALIGVFA